MGRSRLWRGGGGLELGSGLCSEGAGGECGPLHVPAGDWEPPYPRVPSCPGGRRVREARISPVDETPGLCDHIQVTAGGGGLGRCGGTGLRGQRAFAE